MYLNSVPSNARTSNTPFEKFNFHDESINWDLIKQTLLNVDWDKEFEGLNIEDQFSKLLAICCNISAEYVPIRKLYSLSKPKKIPRDRHILMRKRNKIQKKLIHSLHPNQIKKLKEQLVDIELHLQKSYKKTLHEDETRAINAIQRNPKYFFSYAKKHSRTKAKVGPLLDDLNQYVTDSKTMADLLQKQYKTVFSKPQQGILPDV